MQTIIMAAPNGATRSKKDHKSIAITLNEIVQQCENLVSINVPLIHLHIRNNKHQHLLDADVYKETINAINKKTKKAIIQVTTESSNTYNYQEQYKLIKELKPRFVSIALRELCPNIAIENEFAKLISFMQKEKIIPQYILYSKIDALDFIALKKRGIIPEEHNCLLFVMGRHDSNNNMNDSSSIKEILPFINTFNESLDDYNWFSCCFGKLEIASSLSTTLLGGHPRIGFENNLYHSNGQLAKDQNDIIEIFQKKLDGLSIKQSSYDDIIEKLSLNL